MSWPNTLTKKELIEKLQDFPDDTKVYVRDETHYLWIIEDVVADEHGIAIYFDYDDPSPP
jgi:hypothetical protein